MMTSRLSCLLSSAAALDSMCTSASQWNEAGTYANSRGTGSCADVKSTIDGQLSAVTSSTLESWCTTPTAVWTKNSGLIAAGEALHGYWTCCADGETVCDQYMPNICTSGLQLEAAASVHGQSCAHIMWANYIGFSKSQAYCNTADAEGVKNSVRMAAHVSCCTDTQTYCTQYLTNPCTGNTFNPTLSVGTMPCSSYIASTMPTIATKDQAWCDALDSTQTPNRQSLAPAAACCTDGQTFCTEVDVNPCNAGVTYTATNNITPIGGSSSTCGEVIAAWGLVASELTSTWCSQTGLDPAGLRSNGASISPASACCSDGKTFCSQYFSTPCADDKSYTGSNLITFGGVHTTCDTATKPWGLMLPQKNGAWCLSTSLDASNTVTNGVTMKNASGCCADGKTFCTDRMLTMCKNSDSFRSMKVTVGGGGFCHDVLNNLVRSLGAFQSTEAWCKSVSGSSTKGVRIAMAAAECCSDALSMCDDHVAKVNPCFGDSYFVPSTTVTYANTKMICGSVQYPLATLAGFPATITAKGKASGNASGAWCTQNMNNVMAAPTNRIILNELTACCTDAVTFCSTTAATPHTSGGLGIFVQALEQYGMVSLLLNANPLASISLAASFLKDALFK